MPHRVRVWDLPTRLFHWLLVLSVIGLVITGYVGGNAMDWHARIGYAVFTLLLFRIIWGFIGGRWSQFRSFAYGPGSVRAYLAGRAHPDHLVGHNPLGAGSVFALLAILVLQVATGLVADDEIANTGPLIKYVSSATSSLATGWHKNYGQWIIVALVSLHVGAIAFYWLRRRQNLVAPMWHGDKRLGGDVPGAVDDGRSRTLALGILFVCALGVAAVVRLGA